jgi:hypothetical protein
VAEPLTAEEEAEHRKWIASRPKQTTGVIAWQARLLATLDAARAERDAAKLEYATIQSIMRRGIDAARAERDQLRDAMRGYGAFARDSGWHNLADEIDAIAGGKPGNELAALRALADGIACHRAAEDGPIAALLAAVRKAQGR